MKKILSIIIFTKLSIFAQNYCILAVQSGQTDLDKLLYKQFSSHFNSHFLVWDGIGAPPKMIIELYFIDKNSPIPNQFNPQLTGFWYTSGQYKQKKYDQNNSTYSTIKKQYCTVGFRVSHPKMPNSTTYSIDFKQFIFSNKHENAIIIKIIDEWMKKLLKLYENKETNQIPLLSKPVNRCISGQIYTNAFYFLIT